MEIPFKTSLKNDRMGPWIKVTMWNDDGNDVEFDARVDTGADLSVIPEEYVSLLRHKGGVKISTATGEETRVPIYDTIVVVDGVEIFLHKVITTSAATGLAGCDILEHFDIMLTSGVMIIEPNKPSKRHRR